MTIDNRRCGAVSIMIAAAWLLTLLSAPAFAQSSPPTSQNVAVIEGTVHDAAGKPVAGASVYLDIKGQAKPLETKTKPDGSFVFLALSGGEYSLKAEKSGLYASASEDLTVSAGETKHVNLVLKPLGTSASTSTGTSAASQSSSGTLEFADKPDFKVAGVSDWSNLGLHAGDTNVRTSEALTKQTLALKSNGADAAATPGREKEDAPTESPASEDELRAAVSRDPKSFEANHQLGAFYLQAKKYHDAIPPLDGAFRIDPGDHGNSNDLAEAYKAAGDAAQARDHIREMLALANTGDLHRLLGDLDEQLGDPVEAVREYETAVRLEPSEQNYFDWGSELLLYKAAQPAAEVFAKGAKRYPNSPRMLAGLGAALYAGDSYEEAARRLCEASDLRPADPAPYIFLGEMEIAATAPLPCSERTLERFAREQPDNALANFYYGVALERHGRGSGNAATWQQAEEMLKKAVSIDPKLGEAFLQLGDLYFERKEFSEAISAYEKAIAAKPDLSEAHYQLGLAYKRTGEEAKAREEFHVYQQAQKSETAERQRQEARRFLIVLQNQPQSPVSH